MEPLIITCAMVGAETGRKDTPYLPITASEIGEEAKRVREAGASMVHLHVRRDDGTPTQDREVFAAAIAEIRKRTDIIVQTSTGGAVGMTGDERCQPLSLRPEMCTLTTGTCNFGGDVFSNPRDLLVRIAELARENGVVPEIEVFDAGFIDNARWLEKKGLISFPAHFDFVLGVPGALGADEAVLDFLISRLPPGCTWSVAGVGRAEFPMAALAIERGGHVRVGLEDNIWLEKGVLAKGNAELVAKVAAMAAGAKRPLADPATARAILRVKNVPVA
ncbi:MAG: 3-keto-5-aminohexanoate cleavage protein [Deltaproteobacteria bacterium]|nr:3-keto-5-aminohexanoate cleavage protein [Deltaproteobacteria bacterium]